MSTSTGARAAPIPVVADLTRSPRAVARPLPVTAVRLDDPVWARRQRVLREVMLPAQRDLLESTGRLDNFRRASGTMSGAHQGFYFNDSDVYKWLEAASWSLASQPDAELERDVDGIIATIAAAQHDDGYLDTYHQLGAGGERWTELARTHELYCAGHLIQAAIAHRRVTGRDVLMNVATRFADLICDDLGPAEAGKHPGVDGHPEIEMALVELSRETGERRYLEQARYFLDARGRGLAGGDEYRQDHIPFRELDAVVGHAVRAIYLVAGAADVYAETGEPEILAALERLWKSMSRGRIYVTGGIGSRHDGEAFGGDYELPNSRAYAETCAAIASVMWNWRMLLLTNDAKYADLMEITLYNAVLPGLSLDGRSYFYDNPLSDDGIHQRQPWYECACCPPNIARLLASISGYVFSTTPEGVWLHLYAQSDSRLELHDGRSIRIRQQTDCPWDGDVVLTVDGDGEFSLFLRIPEWCDDSVAIEINGQPYSEPTHPGRYAEVRREWRSGDRVTLRLPMPVRLIEAHPYVAEAAGRVAVRRGPIIYCVEQADNPGIDPRDSTLTTGAPFAMESGVLDLDGATALRVVAALSTPDDGWAGRLYRSSTQRMTTRALNAITVTLVPYFVWANRTPGRMEVWMRTASD